MKCNLIPRQRLTNCVSLQRLVLAALLSVGTIASAADVTVRNVNDTGVGSLRQAIQNANPGDKIVFDTSLAGQTISLTTPLGTFGPNLTIDSRSAAGLTIANADLANVATGTLTLLGDTTFTAAKIASDVTVGPAANVKIDGTVTGNATIKPGGTATVNGTITGQVVSEGTLNVPVGGTTGDVELDAGSISKIDGIIGGNVTAKSGSQFDVSGTVNGTTSIAANVRLIGNGKLAGNTSSSGTMDPGGAGVIDTLKFGSDLSVNGGNVQVDIDAAGTTPGVNNDLYDVDGNVTLSGGIVNVNALPGIYSDGMTYTFLTAGGTVSGTFAGITENFAFYNADLDNGYDPNFVSFKLVDDPTATFAAVGDSCNQTSVGNYLDTLRQTATGDLETVINTLKSSTSDAIQMNLDQLGGQIYPSLVSAQLQHTSFTLAMLRDQLIFDSLGRRPDKQTRGWIRGYGIGGDAERDDCGTHGFSYSLGGTEIALQRGFGNGLDIGLFTNMAWSTVKTDGVSQDADVDSYQYGGSLQYVGGYGYLLGIAGGGNQQYEARRTIINAPGGIDRTAESEFDGSQAFGSLEYGTLFQTGATSWIPHFTMQYVALDQDDFRESGADSINLVGSAIDADSLRSILGLSVQQTGLTSIGPATTKLRFGWMHEYLDDVQEFVSHFQEETDVVTVKGIDLGRDWAVLGVNLQWSMLQNFTTVLGYQGQVNDTQSLHTGAAGLEVRW